MRGTSRGRGLADAGCRTLAALVPRFSALAIVCVPVLALTGLFQSWLQVKTPGALATFYGGALILKLVLTDPTSPSQKPPGSCWRHKRGSFV